MYRSVVVFCTVLLLFPAVSLSQDAQPKRAQPVNLGGKVNTKFDETDPFLLPDGVRLFYASNATKDYDLMVAARPAANKPFNDTVPAKAVNKNLSDERSPFYYAPLKEFYFASNRIPDDAFKDEKNFDIFVSVGGAAPFAIQGANTPVDEMFPWVTHSGAELFFSRKLKDGWRVCVTQGPKLGQPDKGKIVNELPPDYYHTTLAPDGLTMYLQGPLEKGRSGLFKTTRKKVGQPWAKPKALANLCHPEGKLGDVAPALSLDGKTLFFASDRPGGFGGLDLYMIPVSELKAE